jgi:hypothetical protein
VKEKGSDEVRKQGSKNSTDHSRREPARKKKWQRGKLQMAWLGLTASYWEERLKGCWSGNNVDHGVCDPFGGEQEQG